MAGSKLPTGRSRNAVSSSQYSSISRSTVTPDALSQVRCRSTARRSRRPAAPRARARSARRSGRSGVQACAGLVHEVGRALRDADPWDGRGAVPREGVGGQGRSVLRQVRSPRSRIPGSGPQFLARRSASMPSPAGEPGRTGPRSGCTPRRRAGAMDMKGKVVVVTGASSGIGRATAHAFAKAGCAARAGGPLLRPARGGRARVRRPRRAGRRRADRRRRLGGGRGAGRPRRARLRRLRRLGERRRRDAGRPDRRGAGRGLRAGHPDQPPGHLLRLAGRDHPLPQAQARRAGQRLVDRRRDGADLLVGLRGEQMGRARAGRGPAAGADRRAGHPRLHRDAGLDRHADLPARRQLHRPGHQGAGRRSTRRSRWRPRSCG